jgi:2-keto-4-pentenoate hydratase
MPTDPQAADTAANLPPELSDLAQRLWTARQVDGDIDLSTVTLPPTLDDAYAVQAENLRLSGEAVGGFKIGSSSKASQEKLGTDEPWYGAVPASFITGSPATIATNAHTLAVEGEFAFRLGQDLAARAGGYTIDEVRAAVDQVAPAIEVVGRRFEGGPEDKMLQLLVADGGVNVALVLGAARPFTPDMDFRDHAVTMRVNGADRASGVGSMALGDPLNSLLWLVNLLSKQGRGLAKGVWVSTGTCTGIEPAAPGDRAAADFGDLGVVDVTLERS